AHYSLLQECIKLSHDLEHLNNVKRSTNLAQMVDQFTQKNADKRIEIFPGWKQDEYAMLTQMSFSSNQVNEASTVMGVNEQNHTSLLNAYAKNRESGMSPDDAFGDVGIFRAESVESLQAAMNSSAEAAK